MTFDRCVFYCQSAPALWSGNKVFWCCVIVVKNLFSVYHREWGGGAHGACTCQKGRYQKGGVYHPSRNYVKCKNARQTTGRAHADKTFLKTYSFKKAFCHMLATALQSAIMLVFNFNSHIACTETVHI